MKRAALTVAFAMLGFVSLWYCSAVDGWACKHISHFCVAKGCTEIGECHVSFWRGAWFISVVFGPSVVFGLSAFIFSRSRRTWIGWFQLLGSLVAAHWAIMFVMRLI